MQFTFEEAARSENVDLGASDWLKIGQERVDGFAEVTEDRQWIHIDREKAATGPFGGTIAHGYLVLSLLPRLFAEVFEIRDASMTVNYGLDKVRFIQPVPADGEVRLVARLVSSTPRGDRILIRIRGDIEMRRGESSGKRAVVAETLFLAAPPE
ncbi:MAG: MaoC family dehydratase [Thermoanaerobaculia bacterium]|nr:MaoC family dehydratase [Thermoanaerobaculia bacterium]